MSITKTAEWARLVDLSKTVGQSSIREAFQADPARFDKFNLKLNEGGNELLFDFSKNRIDESVMKELRNLAKVANVEEMKKKMFNGEKINFTEDRAVFHVALRHQGSSNFGKKLIDLEFCIRFCIRFFDISTLFHTDLSFS